MAYDSEDFKGPNGVNVGEILRVADLVERSKTFDMTEVHHTCGTPACIAGHVLGSKRSNTYEAAIILGIDDARSDELFYLCSHTNAFTNRLRLEAVTPAWAAACLRNLAATGAVDWKSTKPAVAK